MIPAEASSFIAQEKVIIEHLVVILVTATAVALLFQRLRLAIIPAFIVAGVLAGPSAFAFSRSIPALEEIAHLAVVLLLYGVGMELHLSSLRSGFRRLISSSIASMFFTIGLLWPLGIYFELSTVQSLTVAMALSLSSTAVVLRTLSLRREMITSHGQLSLAILVTQDLAVLGMLAFIPLLASWGGYLDQNVGLESNSFVELLGQLSLLLIAVMVVVILAQRFLPLLLREAVRDRSGELPVLAGVAIALSMAYLSQKLGFSLEMGAFLAGFVLASSPFRYQLAGRMTALRDLFMAVFFTTLGMELDLNVVVNQWVVILSATIGLLLLKAVAIALAAWVSGISGRVAVRVGLSLAQAGEFSLILLSQAADYGIFNAMLTSVIIAIVVLSLILTPTIFHFAPAICSRVSPGLLAPWFSLLWQRETGEKDDDRSSLENGIIIAGYGPIGRHLTAGLDQFGLPYRVAELNPRTAKYEQDNGRPVLFGDISDDQILKKLDIENCSVLVLTFPEIRSSLLATSRARALAPGLLIIARALTERDRKSLIDAGANIVSVDESASAEAMLSVVTDNIIVHSQTQHVGR